MTELHAIEDFKQFRHSLRDEFESFLDEQAQRFPQDDCLRIDMHCHDHNSDVPDELWGRLLGLPESWLKTRNLVKCLHKHGANVVTVTNHNNARSCWDLQDLGVDVLVGTEFTCYFPEYNLFIHVLAYGFTREQEKVFNEKRSNIYDFVRYAAEQNIPLVQPHPLYFYTRNDKIDLDLFEKFAVMFQRFEVLNGQRDKWQSVLTLNWLQSLTEDKILQYGKKHGLDPSEFGVDPSRPKAMTGGSDDHMGIFAGSSGTLLYIPDLQQRLLSSTPSQLALEAIRTGNTAPYGYVGEHQKLSIALFDYFSQVAVKIKDPGLLRLLFHRGEISDKAACFVVGNLLLELQKHKNTKKFFNFVHDALQGKKPSKLVKWKVKKDYRFCISHLENIAACSHKPHREFVETANQAIPELFRELNLLLIKRVRKTIGKSPAGTQISLSSEELVRKFEVPMQIRNLFLGGEVGQKNMTGVDFSEALDQLSFPTLVATILMGTSLASTRLLYQNRVFLNEFAQKLGKNNHPKRALYLTDTLLDRNGVSNSLSGKLKEIQRQDLPVDFLICHDSASADSHLHVVRPLETFSVGGFGEQEIRIPDLMEIAEIFYEGGYDRVICSTEGPMAAVALLLKHMFNVPAYFFMHTDWLEFIKENTDLNHHERDRIRRLMRFFYSQFAGVFVLNTEHRNWLTGYEMQLEEDRVMLTAHHTAKPDGKIELIHKSDLFPDATDGTPVLMFAGRLSREKGVFELPEIMARIRVELPDARLVVAGTGPDEAALKDLLPEAHFTGWINKPVLHGLYSSLDLKLFPTRFDTFGNVILEAFSYGMPVASFNCKGPADLIQHGRSGFLAETTDEMANQVIRYLQDQQINRQATRRHAIARAAEYQAEPIMSQFMLDLGLQESTEPEYKQLSVA